MTERAKVCTCSRHNIHFTAKLRHFPPASLSHFVNFLLPVASLIHTSHSTFLIQQSPEMSKRKAASIGGPSHAKKGKRLGASEETRDNNSEAPVLVDDSEPFEGFGDDQPTPIATPQLDNINDGLSSMPVDEKPNYRSHSFALEVEAHDDSHHLGPSDSGDDEVSLSDNDGEEGGSEDEELSDDEVVDDNEEIEEVDGGAESQEAEGEDDEEEDDDDEFYQYPEDYGETSSYGQAWKEV